MAARHAHVAWFEELGEDDRDAAGGKAVSLGRLTAAGIRVPPGFVVTTFAFRQALAGFDPGGTIALEVERLDAADEPACRAASAGLRARVEGAPLPKDVEDAILDAYRTLCGSGSAAAAPAADAPVAVRSSATMEDGSDASFAGLQDTFLWVRGESAVLDAVRRCWASLYSEPSVSYRRRLKLPESAMAMGVVVQQMVDARSAGVMFTRSPVTGDPSLIAISASWGLGSAVVGGEVTPDEFVVNKVTGQLARQTISDKAIRHVPNRATGGIVEEPVPPEARELPSLSGDEVNRLATLGRAIERHYGRAQDIEWAICENGDAQSEIFLLQSRPETVWSSKEQRLVETVSANPFANVLAIFGAPRKE
jgi:pyruvate,water dikinase